MTATTQAPAPGRPRAGEFLGKYRATVLNNIDPMMMGRLLVTVPDVSGLIPSTWAMPCVPFAGIQNGFLALPLIGSGVWVEFEQGDPDYPVWVGCFWGSGAELPAAARMVPPGVPGVAIQTPLQNSIVLSDVPGVGGVMLRTTTGATIMINDVGIVIDNGKGANITLVGPTVSINGTALVVT
jgi:hypothetical protein